MNESQKKKNAELKKWDKKEHILYDFIYEVQEQAKLIYVDRNHNRVCLWFGGGVIDHKRL